MAWALTLSAMFGVSRQSCGCASNPHGVPVEVVGASKTLMVGRVTASVSRWTCFSETSVSLCFVKPVLEFPSKLWVRLKPSWLVTSPPRSSWVLIE